MEKFGSIEAVAAPMPVANIDTDQLIPKQFLKIVRRTGLGAHLFFDQRYDADGKPLESFILNNETYAQSKILVAGDNFGCGSSREHAVWALNDFGIRCVISTSFSDIFSGNAVKNGLLAAIVSSDDLQTLLKRLDEAPGVDLRVDLEAQTITMPNFAPISFDIDPFRKKKLLAGLDEVAETMQFEDDIAAYEQKRAHADPAFIPVMSA